jgi:hypothetical protein
MGPASAPLPPDPRNAVDDNKADDEEISVLDPRRFTPTLHANLVSEILSLRRELDSKHKFIEELETNFDTARTENESLAEQLSASAKEGRTVRRQLQQLENGTLSALEEIAGERDKAKEANSDLRDKLEAIQKRLRSQEDDSTRVHDMWAREKEVWAGEKRGLERRVHVSESRLKVVLEEIAMLEAEREEANDMSDGEEIPRDSGLGPDSDAGSIRSSPVRRPSTRIARHSRNASNSSYRSIGRNYRMSLMSGTGSEGHARSNGISLADELVFDEEEEDFGDLELDSDDFPDGEMRARRALESRQSMCQDEKAKRILGLSIESQQANRDSLPAVAEPETLRLMHGTTKPAVNIIPQEVTLVFPPPKPELELEPEREPIEERPQYVDTGVQPSPPQSPIRPDTAGSYTTTKLSDATSSSLEVEANQRRKRVSVPLGSQAPSGYANVAPSLMISTSSQTVDQPLSPPATPKIESPATPLLPEVTFKIEVASIATQTETLEAAPEPVEELQIHESEAEKPEAKAQTPPPPPPRRAPPPVPIAVPSITIHAPTSAPPSPKAPLLPPGTKSMATQTTTDLTTSVRSSGMQTEPIRIDQRPVKLPAHLLPSAIRSKPGTPEPGQEKSSSGNVSRKDSHQPVSSTSEKPLAAPSARQDLMALLEKVSNRSVENRYPGNNDNGPLGRDRDNAISRPFRTSSLFAGFDGPSSDEDSDAEHSDEDRAKQYSTPMLSSRNAKNGRVFNSPPTPVPEEKEVSPARPSEDSISSNRMQSHRSSIEKPAKVGKPLRAGVTRQPSIRRSAMIQSGTSAHARSRSPSIGSLDPISKPPFPVPTRSSSRKVPLSKSEGSQSPTLRNHPVYPGRRPYGARQHQRKDSLRKVRSAAVIPKSGRPRSRSPPLPATPVMPPSPPLPPLPTDMVSGQRFGHQHQLSTNTTYTGSGSVASAGYQASVVDAIAATMVGEWMWKYVRKRKPFGGQESPADLSRAGEESVVSSNGVRHKRWVWISPYERSVLWSNKQPTTGTALMGKSGRKRKPYLYYISPRANIHFSHHPVGARRSRQYSHAPQCRSAGHIQPIYPDPDTGQSAQVHNHIARTPLLMVDGAVLLGSLQCTHPRTRTCAACTSRNGGFSCLPSRRSHIAPLACA